MPLLALLYTVSGVTGVAYEVLWARMLGLEFGASTFGVVFTVTAFMAGLGAGSLLGNRHAGRIKNPLSFFARLEMGVALFSLLLPQISQALSSSIDSYSAAMSLPAWFAFQGVVSLLLLMLPATAMGASFPIILKAFSGQKITLGRIYGLNTAGAAIGALLPLWLLPEFGWVAALRIVAALGMLVGLAALFLAGGDHEAEVEAGRKNSASLLRLLPYAGIGAASLMLQVGWTRLFSLVMLRTEYVLAVILAVFLVGMGLGSLISRAKERFFWILPLVAAIFSLASLWAFPYFSKWVEAANFTSLPQALFWQGGVLALMTLPVTFALGAWLPLIASRLEGEGAALYGVNSLGAALGAIAGGFVFIPLMGTPGTIVLAAFGFIVFGLTFCREKKAWAMVPLFALLALPVLHFPQVAKLQPREQAGSHDLYQSEDALMLTQVVEDASGQRLLLTDLQRMDASTEPTAVAVQKNQARLPLLLHPDPHSILFLGLGTGISASGSLPWPHLKRTAVELSSGAIAAAKTWFAPVNQDVCKSMRIERNDARHYLSATREKYDVIVGDLFHPDLAGVGALLSIEQFNRARQHLNDNGIFVQWIALNQFDAQSLDLVLRSFGRVFPDAVLFVDGAHLALVGPRQKLAGAGAMLANLSHLAQQDDATGKEGAWTWLGRFWGPIGSSMGAVQDEWLPQIEYRLPKARYEGGIDMGGLFALLLKNRPKVEVAEAYLSVAAADREKFERAYIGSELTLRSWLAMMQQDEKKAQMLHRYAYQANPADRWIASELADNMMQTLPRAVQQGMDKRSALEKVLKIYPDHTEALRALWHLEEAGGNRVSAESYRLRFKSLSPFDRELSGGAS